MNARVLKPNGMVLLLCEFHRNQQNRTKKRSDMKYRLDRAKKRIVGRHQTPVDATLAPLSSTAIEMTRTTCAVVVKRGGVSCAAASSSGINSKRTGSSNSKADPTFRPTKRAKLCKRDTSNLPAAVIPQSIGLEHLAIIASSGSRSTAIEPNQHIRRVFEPLQTSHRRHDHVDLTVPKPDALNSIDLPIPITRSSASDYATYDLEEDAPCSFIPRQNCSATLDQRWPPDDVQLLEYFIL